MKIEISKEQYRKLIKLVYLGNWMINAIRGGSENEERVKEYDDIEKYIFSFAKDFGLDNFVEYDEEHKEYFATRELEEKTDIAQYIQDYDENAFWDELFYRMSDRDFERKYLQKEISSMSMHKRFEKEEPFREKWDKELMEHGIDRLEIKE
ncbi:MAG: hypothetical protein ABIF17_03535 [Patescibacteria group bacterium]